MVDTKGEEEEDRQLQQIKHDENSERRDWNENGGDKFRDGWRRGPRRR